MKRPPWGRVIPMCFIGLCFIALGGCFAATGKVSGKWGHWDSPIVGWIVGILMALIGCFMIYSAWFEPDIDD